MTALITALLLTVGSAQQDNQQREADAKARIEANLKKLHEREEKIRHIGKMSFDLAAVQTKIHKARLDIEQADTAEQAAMDELLSEKDRFRMQIRHGVILVNEAKIKLLDKADPKKADPKIQQQRWRLVAELQSCRETLDAEMAQILTDVRKNKPQFEERRIAAQHELDRLRNIEKKLSAEVNARIKVLRQP